MSPYKEGSEWYMNNVKLIKYYFTSLASWASRSKNNPDHPDGLPKWIPIFGNKNRKMFFRIFNRRSVKRGKVRVPSTNLDSFVTSLLYNKRCALPVGETFLKESWREYKESLTRPSSSDDVQFDEAIIRACIPLIFPNCKISLKSYCKYGNRCTSSSSALSDGVSKSQIEQLKLIVPFLYGMPLPSGLLSYGIVPNTEGRAVLLSEPLKARTICTIGPEEFYAGKPLQFLMAKSMKRSSFLVFGREVSTDDVQSLVVSSRSFFGTNEELFFVSGDYKNATGFISPYVSRRLDALVFEKLGDFEVPVLDDYEQYNHIIAKIWSYMPRDASQERNWYKLNLYILAYTKHIGLPSVPVSKVRQTLFLNRKISFPKETGFDDVKQTNEQLMGDIKSFPLLCLLNYSLWFAAASRTRRYEKNDLGLYCIDSAPPCLINGDDFLAYAPLSVIKKWEDLTRTYSFVLSVGKTYVSKTHACINSTMFTLFAGKVKQVPICRLNVAYESRKRPIDAVSRELTLGGLRYYPRLYELFIKWNRKNLNEYSRNGLINWCLPVYQGGLGLSPIKPIKISKVQELLIKYSGRRSLKGKLFYPDFRLEPTERIKKVNKYQGLLDPWDTCLEKVPTKRNQNYVLPWACKKFFHNFKKWSKEKVDIQLHSKESYGPRYAIQKIGNQIIRNSYGGKKVVHLTHQDYESEKIGYSSLQFILGDKYEVPMSRNVPIHPISRTSMIKLIKNEVRHKKLSRRKKTIFLF
jgi:hypothetical protein